MWDNWNTCWLVLVQLRHVSSRDPNRSSWKKKRRVRNQWVRHHDVIQQIYVINKLVVKVAYLPVLLQLYFLNLKTFVGFLDKIWINEDTFELEWRSNKTRMPLIDDSSIWAMPISKEEMLCQLSWDPAIDSKKRCQTNKEAFLFSYQPASFRDALMIISRWRIRTILWKTLHWCRGFTETGSNEALDDENPFITV